MDSVVDNGPTGALICEHCQREVMAEALRVGLFMPMRRLMVHNFQEVSLETIFELALEMRRYLGEFREYWMARTRVTSVTTFHVGCWLLMMVDAIEEIYRYWLESSENIRRLIPPLGEYIEELRRMAKALCVDWAMSLEVQELLYLAEGRGLLQFENRDAVQLDQDSMPNHIPAHFPVSDSVAGVDGHSDRDSSSGSSDNDSLAGEDGSSDRDSTVEMDSSLDPEFTPDVDNLTLDSGFGPDSPDILPPMPEQYRGNLEENSDRSPFFWIILCTIVLHLTIRY